MLYRIVEVGWNCNSCIEVGGTYYMLVPMGIETSIIVATTSTLALGVIAWALSRDWNFPLLLPLVLRIKRARVDDTVKASIISLLEEKGAMTIYEIARELGMRYNAVRWHVYVLEREGIVKSEKRRGKTYVKLV